MKVVGNTETKVIPKVGGVLLQVAIVGMVLHVLGIMDLLGTLRNTKEVTTGLRQIGTNLRRNITTNGNVSTNLYLFLG